MHRFDDPARAIRVAPGEVFAIALAGNPTTGYTWQTDFGADRANVRAGRSRCRSWSTGGVPFSGCGSRYNPDRLCLSATLGWRAARCKALSRGDRLTRVEHLLPLARVGGVDFRNKRTTEERPDEHCFLRRSSCLVPLADADRQPARSRHEGSARTRSLACRGAGSLAWIMAILPRKLGSVSEM